MTFHIVPGCLFGNTEERRRRLRRNAVREFRRDDGLAMPEGETVAPEI
jgi:hypothetical protein